MAVQSARSLKAEHDRALGRSDAAKVANATIKHREEVLAANREANSLDYAIQVAQQSSDMEVTKLTEVAKVLAKGDEPRLWLL